MRYSTRFHAIFATSIVPILVLADLLAVIGGSLSILGHVTVASLVGAAVGIVIVSRGLSLYQSRLELSVLEDFPAFLATTVVASLLMLGLAGPTYDSTGGVLVGFVVYALSTSVLLVLLRTVAYVLVRGGRRRGVLSHPVIVVGAGDVGRHLARALIANRGLGLTPIGFVDDGPVEQRTLPAPFLGRLRELPHAMSDLHVHDVIFAFGNEHDRDTLSLVRHVQRRHAQIFVVPRFFEMLGLDRPTRTELVDQVPVFRLRRWRVRPHAMFAKRAFDIVVSGVSLLVLSPLLAAIAVAVRIETGPKVIFRQKRVGRAGKTFELMKFRSMVTTTRESATRWNIDGDVRIGGVGRFLRRTGLDELPQLWNILRGDMSLVGPRPERPHFVEQFSRDTRGYRSRHRLHTGLTGWAQVHHLRGDTSIADRVRADNYYIENWSLWGDIKIVVRTLGTFRRPPVIAPSTLELIAEFETPSGSAISA